MAYRIANKFKDFKTIKSFYIRCVINLNISAIAPSMRSAEFDRWVKILTIATRSE